MIIKNIIANGSYVGENKKSYNKKGKFYMALQDAPPCCSPLFPKIFFYTD